MPADVVITEDVWGQPFEILRKELVVDRQPSAWQSPELLPQVLAGARAVVVRNRTQVTEEVLAQCPELRVVARAGVGLDNIDLRAADGRGVVVVAPVGANAVSVAEHSLGLALALARGLVTLDRRTRSGRWDRTPGIELSGRTWGLLGAGATGRACARLARALGMEVLAYDPYISPRHSEIAELGIRLVDLEDVARGADVISCHLPATADTTGLIGAEFLGLTRPNALLVNVGRGEVVDENALADALDAGQLGGAALDVRETEPPVPGRLERMENVILTPHVAGITDESQRRILTVLAEDITTVLAGGAARYAVGATKGGEA